MHQYKATQRQDSYNLAKENNVFTADEKETALQLCENVLVVYSLDCVFEYQVCWEDGGRY